MRILSLLGGVIIKDLVCIRRVVELDRHTYSQHPHYLEQERTCPVHWLLTVFWNHFPVLRTHFYSRKTVRRPQHSPH